MQGDPFNSTVNLFDGRVTKSGCRVIQFNSTVTLFDCKNWPVSKKVGEGVASSPSFPVDFLDAIVNRGNKRRLGEDAEGLGNCQPKPKGNRLDQQVIHQDQIHSNKLTQHDKTDSVTSTDSHMTDNTDTDLLTDIHSTGLGLKVTDSDMQ